MKLRLLRKKAATLPVAKLVEDLENLYLQRKPQEPAAQIDELVEFFMKLDLN